MASTLGQNETLITSSERGSIFNCVITPTSNPKERSIKHEDVILNYWAQMSFNEPSAGPYTMVLTADVPTKLTMFNTSSSTDDMTVTVGGSPADSKITIVKTGWYVFHASLSWYTTTNTKSYLSLYWNGAEIANMSPYIHTNVLLVSTSIGPFFHNVNSASQDFEIYVEASKACNAEFYEGHAMVRRVQ